MWSELSRRQKWGFVGFALPGMGAAAYLFTATLAGIGSVAVLLLAVAGFCLVSIPWRSNSIYDNSGPGTFWGNFITFTLLWFGFWGAVVIFGLLWGVFGNPMWKIFAAAIFGFNYKVSTSEIVRAFIGAIVVLFVIGRTVSAHD
jgi:hypothetical protein